MSKYLRANDVLTGDAGERIVLAVNPTHDLVELLSAAACTTEHYSYRQLRKEIASGAWKVAGAETVKGTVRNAAEDSPQLKTFLFRVAVATKLKAKIAQGKTKREAIKDLLHTDIVLASGEEWPMCSEREAYRILSLTASDESALMPAYSSRGNHRPRYDERVKEIVLEHVESLYAVPKSPIKIQTLTKLVNHSARAEGVLAESAEVSRKYIQTVIVNHWNPDLDYKRLDPRVAKSLKAVAGNRIRPGAPLNRVEMDSLHLPFLAKTEYGIADDIWIMIAIDCETSHPLGWWLMPTRPTTEDTWQCLERTLYPKTRLLTNMGINFAVDPYGTIQNLVWDNGSENSRHQMAGITQIGINPYWTEHHSGNRKPFIERLNRSLKDALEVLPGCTRCNGKDGERTEEAKNDDLMSIKELEQWLVRWLFEKWPHTPIDRFITADYEIDDSLGFTPAERWSNYESRMALPLSPPLGKWRALRYQQVDRALNAKTGVSFRNYDFKGDNLKTLIAQYGPDARVQVYYNLFDYRTVYVPDKFTGEWIVLVNAEVDENTPAYSYDEAKKRRSKKRNQISKHPAATAFDNDLHEKVLASSKKHNRAQARKDAHAITRTQQAVQRGMENPLTPTPKPKPLDPTTYIADDAIPSFKTHHKPPRTPR